MEKTPVTCPNCEGTYFIAHDTQKGKCQFCKISLIYEDVEVPKEEIETEKEIDEKVDINFVEKKVDTVFEESKAMQSHHIADVSAIETIQPKKYYISIEKEVDKIIKEKKTGK